MYTSYNEACARDCSTLRQDLELCEQAGFDYIEIRLDMLRDYLKTGTLEELAEFFAHSHLKPHALNAVYLREDLFSDPGSSEPSNSARDSSAPDSSAPGGSKSGGCGEADGQDPVLDDFFLACRAGQAIGSHFIIIVPPFDPSGVFTGDPKEAEANCARILKKLSALARPYGMNLCFELVGMEKSCIRTVEAADRVIRAVDEDNTGFVFDSCNIYLNGRCNDFTAIERVQPKKLFAVHLMDIDQVPDRELGQDKRRFACDGSGLGAIDIGGFLTSIKKTGYTGMVSVETFRPQYWEQTPQWVISQAYQTVRKALEINNCL